MSARCLLAPPVFFDLVEEYGRGGAAAVRDMKNGDAVCAPVFHFAM